MKGRDEEYMGRRTLEMNPADRRKRRLKRRFIDEVKEHMEVVTVTEEDTEGRARWRWVICCGGP